MKAQHYFILFFGVMLNFSFAQTTISGSVVIDNSEESLEDKNIIIINQNTNKRVLADQDGLFRLEVALNDVIEVRSALTETRKIKISENILNNKFVEIHLDIETIELAEAKINPLNKYLKNNISNEKSEQEKIFEIIGFDSAFKLDMIKYRLALNYIKKYKGNLRYENILKLKDDFDKDARNYKPEIRKEKIRNVRMEEILSIREFFTEQYFNHYLLIPTNKITDFVSYCYDLHNFQKLIKQQNFDQMFYFFEEEASNYIQLLNQK